MRRNFQIIMSKFAGPMLCLALIGCASTSKKSVPVAENKDGKLSEQQSLEQEAQEKLAAQSEESKKAFEALSKRVDKLIKQAKEAGDSTLDYLADDLFLKASAASINSDHLTARELFANLLKIRPEDEYVKSRYAIELIRTGSLSESKVILEDIHKKSKGKNSRVGLILAGVYSALGEDKQARVVYRDLLKIDKSDEDACIFLSKSYTKSKEYKAAMKVLRKCERADRKNAVFAYYIGKVYLIQGELKKSFYHFKRALKVDKSFDQAAVALGILHEEKGEWRKAAKIYKDQIERNESGRTNSLLLNRLVQAYFALEEFFKVIPYAEMLSDLEPDNLNIKGKLGILYTDVKKFEKAIQVFSEILKAVPDSDKILFYVGAIYQEMKEFERSIEHLHRIGPSSDLYKDSTLQIAQMLSQMAFERKDNKGHERFFSYTDKILKEKGVAHVQVTVVKSNHLEGMGEFKKAIDSLLTIEKRPDFGMSQKYYLASLWEKTKDYKKAEDIMWSILKEDSQNAHAWNFLGYSLLERGIEMPRAFEYISKAVELSPEDGYIRDSLGWFHYKSGNLKLALKELKKASSLVSDDAVILKHIAIVYRKLKKFELAKKFCFRALEYTKIEEERQELFQIIDSLASKRTPATQTTKD